MVFWIFVAATCALSIAADVRWHEKSTPGGGAGTPFTAEALRNSVYNFGYSTGFARAVPLPVGRRDFLFSGELL